MESNQGNKISNKDRLLIVVPDFIPTAKIIIKEVEYCNNMSIEVIKENQITLKKLMGKQQKLFFVRTSDSSFQFLFQLLNKLNIKYTYYIDDNFWELQGDNPLVRYFKSKYVRQTLVYIVSHADRIICGSINLKEYIRKYNKQVDAIKASFDFRLIDGLSQNKQKDVIKIYYAGSLYRGNDFEPVYSALKKLSMEYKQKIKIYFNGFVPNQLDGLETIVCDKNFYEYDSFIKKQYVAAFDIGLAPIADTMSNRAKSNVKYREYSACNIAGIYSNLPPYSNCIENNINGLLVDHSSDAWYTAIKTLIEDKELRNKIIANAKQDIRENYSLAKVASLWQEFIKQMPINSAINVPISLEIKYFIAYYYGYVKRKIARVFDYLKTEGFNATIKKIYFTATKKNMAKV